MRRLDHAALFAQTADGSLAAPVQIPHGWNNPGSIALLHATADGILDLAIISEDGLELIPSLGGGAFGPVDLRPVTATTCAPPTSISTATPTWSGLPAGVPPTLTATVWARSRTLS